MVRVLAPPLEGVSPLEVHPLRRERETPNVDPEVGMIPNRYEVDPDIRKDPRTAQVSDGFRNQLLLPLHYNSWGCGGFLGAWSTGNHIPEDTEYIGRTGRKFWGFDDAYPMMLRDRLPQEDWQYAIARINTGYISTIWPKMVWVPFWVLLVVGAILEGVLHYTENEVFTKRSFPIGGGIGICVAMGLLISLGLMQISYAAIKLDFERIKIQCTKLTEQFRESYVSFALFVESGPSGRSEARNIVLSDLTGGGKCRLIVRIHEEDVDIDHVTIDVNKYVIGGNEDCQMVHIDKSGGRVCVYSTERVRPRNDMLAGRIKTYGRAPKPESQDQCDGDADEDEWEWADKELPAPSGGFCGCQPEQRRQAILWKQNMPQDFDYITNTVTYMVWRNQQFQTCPLCRLPIFNIDAHARACFSKNDPEHPDYILKSRQDPHLGRVFITPREPKWPSYKWEERVFGLGWSAGFMSSCTEDPGTLGEEGKDSVCDSPQRYCGYFCLSCCCNHCVQTHQRYKIRQMYGITVEDPCCPATCLTLCCPQRCVPNKCIYDGCCHDYCVVAFCPILALIHHVNHLKWNKKAAYVMCADDETINNLANASASRPPDPLQMGEKKQTKENKRKKKQQVATGSTQEESAV